MTINQFKENVINSFIVRFKKYLYRSNIFCIPVFKCWKEIGDLGTRP